MKQSPNQNGSCKGMIAILRTDCAHCMSTAEYDARRQEEGLDRVDEVRDEELSPGSRLHLTLGGVGEAGKMLFKGGHKKHELLLNFGPESRTLDYFLSVDAEATLGYLSFNKPNTPPRSLLLHAASPPQRTLLHDREVPQLQQMGVMEIQEVNGREDVENLLEKFNPELLILACNTYEDRLLLLQESLTFTAFETLLRERGGENPCCVVLNVCNGRRLAMQLTKILGIEIVIYWKLDREGRGVSFEVFEEVTRIFADYLSKEPVKSMNGRRRYQTAFDRTQGVLDSRAVLDARNPLATTHYPIGEYWAYAEKGVKEEEDVSSPGNLGAAETGAASSSRNRQEAPVQATPPSR